MEEIVVRAIQRGDQSEVPTLQKFLGWFEATPNSDKDICEYPALQMWQASNGKTIAFLPVHTVAMLESVAHNPEATDRELAEGLRQLVKTVYTTAWSSGIREIWFAGTDERINRIAERHGFQPVAVQMYRLKMVRT